ncbi:flagellar basal body-associated FliL family protein [Celeribacter sp.]|uniref:flagellar basal body-associated FliL family protein n=1 Tax=Celeribacter sp. TaxID=1890673 RepID=UPI003A8DCDAD
MSGKIIPILLALLGLGLGIGGGLMFRPSADVAELGSHSEDPNASHQIDTHNGELPESATTFDYVKLNNQFVIPDMEDGRVAAMIVLSISLETMPNVREKIYAQEPKLRDAFLQVLFDHANIGGFKGSFTETTKMQSLRTSLLEAATAILGDDIESILVTDIVRQDVG